MATRIQHIHHRHLNVSQPRSLERVDVRESYEYDYDDARYQASETADAFRATRAVGIVLLLNVAVWVTAATVLVRHLA